ncbi:hypothetical protein J1605_010881 [Eschrichtius robustus]|uniref:CSN8/PSMD8/EIF3K domain-containing protein n=1 Tax=Eschrichtius robustus TaxID=9764 RepID=A0AB34GNJ3_ESCRO|nr:hypothetical protein J1605_010881 [Eschrichtius robustus]
MPVAVMAESSFSFRKLLDQCENQELEVTIRLVGSRLASGRAGLQDATRRRAFALVSQAYTSIIADDFAAFVGLPVEEAVKGILEQGWQADSTTRMVMPKKPEPAPVPPIPNEQQLARLTDYVAFLEN